MKISVTTYEACTKLGWENGLSLIKDSGFDGVDFSLETDVLYEALEGDYREWARSKRAYMDAIGLECVQAHAPCNTVLYGDPLDESHKGFVEVTQAMEIAAIVGAPIIVVHAVMVPPMFDPSEAIDINIRYYKALLPYCEKFGIRVAIENLYAYCAYRERYISLLDTPQEMLAVYHGVNSPWVTVCLDLGHASFLDYHAEHFIPHLGKGVIGAIHAHDTNLREDSHLLPFTGKMNFPAIIQALKAVEYDGAFSLEVPYFFNRLPNELQADAHQLAARVARYIADQLEA